VTLIASGSFVAALADDWRGGRCSQRAQTSVSVARAASGAASGMALVIYLSPFVLPNIISGNGSFRNIFLYTTC